MNIDAFITYDENQKIPQLNANKHDENATRLKRVAGLVQIHLDNDWYLKPNSSLLDNLTSVFNWYDANESKVVKISDKYYQIRQYVEPDVVKCARIGLLIFAQANSSNTSRLMHRVSSSQEICPGLCEKYDPELLKKVSFFFEKTLFAEYLNTEDNEVKSKDNDKKRGILIEIPTLSEVKDFLNTKLKSLKNKTIDGIDWLREKLVSMDKLENDLEAKLGEIKKNSEAKLIDLFREDSNMTKALRDFLNQAESSKSTDEKKDTEKWLNDILNADQLDDAKENIIGVHTKSFKKSDNLDENNKISKRRKRRSFGVLSNLARSQKFESKKLYVNQAPIDLPAFSSIVIDTEAPIQTTTLDVTTTVSQSNFSLFKFDTLIFLKIKVIICE